MQLVQIIGTYAAALALVGFGASIGMDAMSRIKRDTTVTLQPRVFSRECPEQIGEKSSTNPVGEALAPQREALDKFFGNAREVK